MENRPPTNRVLYRAMMHWVGWLQIRLTQRHRNRLERRHLCIVMMMMMVIHSLKFLLLCALIHVSTFLPIGGYSIEPSVELWNSIDFNHSKSSKEVTSSKTKRVSKYAESCENLMASNLSVGENVSSSTSSSLGPNNDYGYSSPSKSNLINPKQTTTPPSFKATSNDYVPVASSNGATSRASIQVEQLKKTLLQLEAQKIEAEDRRRQAELDKQKVHHSLTHSPTDSLTHSPSTLYFVLACSYLLKSG